MGTESVLFVAKTKKERRMANKIDYNWVYDDKDDSFVMMRLEMLHYLLELCMIAL